MYRVVENLVQEFDPDSGLWFPAQFPFDVMKTTAYVTVDGKRMTVWDFEQFHQKGQA